MSNNVNKLMPLNCVHLKIVKMKNFMLCIFYHGNEKKKKEKTKSNVKET